MSEPAAKDILIAYSSRYGATREIAEFIAGVLERLGLQTVVQPADEVTKVAPYRAAIIGSGVYYSGWLDEVVELLESFQDELAERPVWLFSDGPTDELDLDTARRAPEGLSSLLGVIAPQDVALFGGRVVGDELSLDDWLVNPALRSTDTDERDWQGIKQWAEGIAETLRGHAAPTDAPRARAESERRKS